MANNNSTTSCSEDRPFQDALDDASRYSLNDDDLEEPGQFEDAFDSALLCITNIENRTQKTKSTKWCFDELAEIRVFLDNMKRIRGYELKQKLFVKETINATMGEIVPTIINQILEPITQKLESIQTEVQELRDNPTERPQQQQQHSYAEVVSASTIPWPKTSLIPERDDPVLVLSSTSKRTSTTNLRDRVRAAAKNSGTDIVPKEAILTRNNRMILKFKSREEASSYQKETTEFLEKDLTLYQPNIKRKSIILINTPVDAEKESIISKLKEIIPSDPDHLEITYTTPPRRGLVNHIVELDILSYAAALSSGKLLLEYCSVPIKPNFNPLRCRRCQLLGHTIKRCTAPPRCGICAQPHRDADCHRKVSACVNCINDQRETHDHPSFSPTCSLFREKKEAFLRKEYELINNILYGPRS